MMYNNEDMPFNKEGVSPDIILNHCIPSRMTLAHLIETILGKSCLNMDMYDGTPFNINPDDVGSILELAGFEKGGMEILYNGITGEQMQANVFIGLVIELKHMVEDKYHARSTGPKVRLTGQPSEGRTRDGGYRFGEMERDCMIAWWFIVFKEIMLDKSDNYEHIYVKNVDILQM